MRRLCYSFLLCPVVVLADTLATDSGDITITPQIHASVQVAYGELVIQIDPWGAAGLERYNGADLILITDNPGHHLDPGAIAALRRPGTRVIAPDNSRDLIADVTTMRIGEQLSVAGVHIEAVAAYDIIPGAPEHPRGDALGYVVSLGDRRLLFAGVTECVDEVKALAPVDVAFLPMNIPPMRMTPEAAAECARLLGPEIVYIYHFDQSYARRLNDPDYEAPPLPGGIDVAQSLLRFARALEGTGIEFRQAEWYPQP